MTRPRISSRQLPGEHCDVSQAGLQPVAGPLLEMRDPQIFPFITFSSDAPIYTTAERNLQALFSHHATKIAEMAIDKCGILNKNPAEDAGKE